MKFYVFEDEIYKTKEELENAIQYYIDNYEVDKQDMMTKLKITYLYY